MVGLEMEDWRLMISAFGSQILDDFLSQQFVDFPVLGL
jgi:hypothetical protein